MIHPRRSLFLLYRRGLRTLIHPISNQLDHTEFMSPLCPHIVNTTISNCPSDTLSLSFFLWCARQPGYFHSPNSFDHMLPVVNRLTDRFGSVANIVEELRSVGCPVKALTFLVLLRIYWRSCSYKFALEVFEEMCRYNFEPNTFARNVVIDILFKTGHVDSAMRFMRETQFPNYLTFSICLTNLCKIGDWLAVRDVLRSMVGKSFYFTTGSFWAIFDCCRKRGTISELYQLLAFMVVSGIQPTLPIWSILIEGLCQAGEINMACRYLQRMVQMGFSPSVVTCTSIIKGMFKAERYDSVIGLLDYMKCCKCKPDLVLYNVLMDCFAKSGRYSNAISVFFDLLDNNFKPDNCTLSTVMSVLCFSGNIELFDSLITHFDIDFDLKACNSVMNTFDKAGYPYRAVKFFRHMVENNFNPDSYTYTALINSLFQLGKIDSVVEMYCKLVTKDHNIDSYVHAAILGGLVKRGKHYTAKNIITEAILEGRKLDAACYTIGIKGLFKAGMNTEACELFECMKRYGVSPNLHTYNVILHGFCMADDSDSLQKLLQEMNYTGIEMDSVSFNTLIAYLFKSNRTKSALALIRTMVVAGVNPDRITNLLVSKYVGNEFGKESVNFGVSVCDQEDADCSDVSGGSDSSDDIIICSSM